MEENTSVNNNLSVTPPMPVVQAVSPDPVPVVAQPEHTRLSIALQYLKQTVFVLLHIAVFLFLIRSFVVEPAIVNGRSMEMTLVDTDRVLVNKLQMLFDAPDRYDIIQMYDEVSGNYYIKRVIGLPGETVVIAAGAVCIEDAIGVGTCLDETYLQDFVYTSVKIGQDTHISVPEGSYFVMGDNRLMSTDSRDLGPIGRNFFLGNVMGVE